MKDIIRAANRIAAFLPESMQLEWSIVVHDTEAFKALTPEEVEEAKAHLEDLLNAKAANA